MPILRRTGTLAAAALVLALLAGCAAGAPSAEQAPPVPVAAAEPGAYPVTVPTAFGDVTVTEQPQRVVALGWSDAETALQLGVTPVGAADWQAIGGDGLGPWMTTRYTTQPAELGTLEVDLEAIAALEPDLVLDTRASGDPARQDRLAQLGVPVVGIPPGSDSFRTAWRDQLRMVGAALGRPQEAARLQSELEGRFAEARERNPQLVGATVVSGVRSSSTGEYAAYSGREGQLGLFSELGMVNSPQITAQPTEGFSVSISRERMNLLDADVTVMQLVGGDGSEVRNDPLWRAVPSVAAGRGILLDDVDLSRAVSSQSVDGWRFALDRVVEPLARAAASAPR